MVAGLVGAEAVEVTLRSPPPLEQPLRVIRDGGRVELRDGDQLVAEGVPADHLLEVPDPVPAEEVAAAEAGGRRLDGRASVSHLRRLRAAARPR